jgi:hypothetical protein
VHLVKRAFGRAIETELGSAGSYFSVVLVMLLLIFPNLTDNAGLLTRTQVVLLYFEMAGIITLSALALWIGVSRLVTNPVLSPLIVGLLTFVLLCSYALLVGTSPREFRSSLPLEFMHGHFFGDFMFLKFAFLAAPASGILGAVVVALRAKARLESSQSNVG